MTTRISENLKRLRRVKSLSQRDLAKKAGVAQSYISAIEHSKLVPSVKIIKRLAIALGQNPEHLVRFHPDEKIKVRETYTKKFVLMNQEEFLKTSAGLDVNEGDLFEEPTVFMFDNRISTDIPARLVNADAQRPSYANVQDETDKAILKVIYALILGFVISAVCLILTIF